MKITIELDDALVAKITARMEQINKNRGTTFTVESFLQKRVTEIATNQASMLPTQTQDAKLTTQNQAQSLAA